MPYFVASILTVVAAMVILFTRYEADDSAITAELEKMKSMFLIVDGFVNTYIDIGESTSSVNFWELNNESILIPEGTLSSNCSKSDKGKRNALCKQKTTYRLPNDKTIWQIIPNIADEYSSYKLFVDFRANASLMSRANFSESFLGREYCQKMLFGKFQKKGNTFNDTNKDFTETGNGEDGKFVCIVYK